MKLAALIVALMTPTLALAGPETAIREYGSGQIKKGVRSIGMGGDGATWGNYSLVYRDAGTAIFDYGVTHFSDTGNTLTFVAVGFTTPTFWDDAALYVIALAQHATGVQAWSLTAPNPAKPPSIGDGSNEAIFVKFAKPLTKTISFGILLSYELSQLTLLPESDAPIRYSTAWRPSGGAGVTWQPLSSLLIGARVILNHDVETRAQGAGSKSGLLRSYEYRLGASVLPWRGGLLDAGFVVLDRYSAVDGTHTTAIEPTAGVEQAIVPKHLWLRAGLDETTWTAGASVRVAPVKLDVAYAHNLAAARTLDVFGHTNDALMATVTYDYEKHAD